MLTSGNNKEYALVEVASAEYVLAEARWFIFWRKPYLSDKSFFQFIKTAEDIPFRVIYNYRNVILSVSPSAARKIKLLAGPYHHAFLAAYKAKRGSHSE